MILLHKDKAASPEELWLMTDVLVHFTLWIGYQNLKQISLVYILECRKIKVTEFKCHNSVQVATLDC